MDPRATYPYPAEGRNGFYAPPVDPAEQARIDAEIAERKARKSERPKPGHGGSR